MTQGDLDEAQRQLRHTEDWLAEFRRNGDSEAIAFWEARLITRRAELARIRGELAQPKQGH